jgi:hydrogenase maturation protease
MEWKNGMNNEGLKVGARRIIGCGHMDRGDDAAGLIVVNRLRKRGIAASKHNGEFLTLIDSWRGVESVVLVDAVVTGAPAGKVIIWDALIAPLPVDCFRCSTHSLGVAEAVELARLLGWLPSCILIYGIEGRQFEIGAPPSWAVLQAVEEVTEKILEQLQSCSGAIDIDSYKGALDS